jgi:hypothetical protein
MDASLTRRTKAKEDQSRIIREEDADYSRGLRERERGREPEVLVTCFNGGIWGTL